MLAGNTIVLDETTVFKSLGKGELSFENVFNEILNYIEADKNSSYKISIGTDSQVVSKTLFVTCIHVHRVGKGAIGFLHKSELARPIKNLREKIYMETCISLQLAYLFDEKKINRIYSSLDKKGITFEFHIDIGRKGETKVLINEMVGMVKGLNFIPKIKPDSFCASCFADRHTKAI
ncbi:ribonuclease H-like YkuK family protein [Herbivorax sp. ANBcel31]|uniref:ribonuclease H-like YkuK family protein n=1 Tax=Herbivorax sp. ANBcel31 TaxID=3069754 RepID=UPI0027B64614|nr:ribonuclease H-like YkuK family protein [Herbivorax sp. ANBcel31]MDQ2088044.1 ribonuclease H-like YkuK family protein [Herbivorax sp. ANBcel31]